MEEFFEEKNLNDEWDEDEVILDEISRLVFCGDIKHDDYSPRICLSSLEYFLLRNFEINTYKELYDLKMRVYGKVIDLSGGSNMSELESRGV